MKRYSKCLILSFVMFSLLAGCAYTLRKEMEVDFFLPNGDFPGAIEDLEGNREVFGVKNRLLYLLNSGAIHFYSDSFAESNECFSEANILSEELYTKSISNEAAGLINPNVVPYDGEDYENILINVFMALNFIKLGMMEDAGVEARIINSKLELLTQKYESKNKYKNDAFGRYLSGIIYEAEGDINNAYISYRQAYKAYLDYQEMFEFEIPEQIKKDILRLAERLGFKDQFSDYKKVFNIEPPNLQSGSGEILVIAMTGLGPYKRENETKFTYPDKEGITHTFQLLIPELVERKSAIGSVSVSCSDDSTTIVVSAQIIEDVTKIAMKNMSDKMPGILVKAWLRAFSKKAATDKAKKKMNTGNVISNWLVGGITDGIAEKFTHADIRCWRTLPSRIYFRRIRVKPGSYNLTIEFRNEQNQCIEKIMRGMEIENEKKYFVFVEKFI